MTPSDGAPIDVNQVVTAATGFGQASRCGCGWRAVHETRIAAIIAGQRHIRLAHPPKPERDAPPKGSAA